MNWLAGMQAGLSQALSAVFEEQQGTSRNSLTKQMEKIRRAEQVHGCREKSRHKTIIPALFPALPSALPVPCIAMRLLLPLPVCPYNCPGLCALAKSLAVPVLPCCLPIHAPILHSAGCPRMRLSLLCPALLNHSDNAPALSQSTKLL